MSFTDPRATLPWGLHDPTAFPDDDDNRGCLKRLTKSVEILMRGLGGLCPQGEAPSRNAEPPALASLRWGSLPAFILDSAIPRLGIFASVLGPDVLRVHKMAEAPGV